MPYTKEKDMQHPRRFHIEALGLTTAMVADRFDQSIERLINGRIPKAIIVTVAGPASWIDGDDTGGGAGGTTTGGNTVVKTAVLPLGILPFRPSKLWANPASTFDFFLIGD